MLIFYFSVPPHTMLYAQRLFRPKLDEKQYTKSKDSTFNKTNEESGWFDLYNIHFVIEKLNLI